VSESAKVWDAEAFDYQVAYALPWKDQLVDDLHDQEVPVHLIGSRRGLTPQTMIRLRDLIRSTESSLVHAHLPIMGTITRLASPVPVVYTEHNLAGSYRRPTRIANRLTYGRNAAVIAVSQAVADSVAGYPGPQPRVIPNGVMAPSDVDRLAIRRELGLGAGQPLVVHVGNIRPGKGHDNLVEAARFLHRIRSDAVIVSCGVEKFPGGLERLRTASSQAGLEGTLRFLGRRPDAVSFTAAADVFVNPSEVEGLPVAVLEAMAAGTPVVATSVGGVPSIIHHGSTGLLVSPADPTALAEGIARLLSDRSAAQRIAEAARRLVEETHGLATMVGGVENIYREILGG